MRAVTQTTEDKRKYVGKDIIDTYNKAFVHCNVQKHMEHVQPHKSHYNVDKYNSARGK